MIGFVQVSGALPLPLVTGSRGHAALDAPEAAAARQGHSFMPCFLPEWEQHYRPSPCPVPSLVWWLHWGLWEQGRQPSTRVGPAVPQQGSSVPTAGYGQAPLPPALHRPGTLPLGSCALMPLSHLHSLSGSLLAQQSLPHRSLPHWFCLDRCRANPWN